jgi:excinuclease ABC subunit B
MPVADLEKQAIALEAKMKRAAKDLDFVGAAQLRDELFALRKLIDEKVGAV